MSQSFKSKTWLALSVMSFLIGALCTSAFEEADSLGQDSPEKATIGTAIFIKKDTTDKTSSSQTTEAIPVKNRKVVHEKTDFYGRDFERQITISAIFRSLKYNGGCRDDTNDIAAVVECTNAVREDPDAYANDYPCDYQQWRNEVVGKVRQRLSTTPLVQRVAQLHTDDQARMNSMTHTGSDGSNLQTRADRLSLPWGSIGENVAAGFSSAKAVVMAWMCSPPHRKNLMSCDFSKIGVGMGVAQGGRNFYTQVFYCDLGEKCGCGASASPAPRPQTYENPAPAYYQPQQTASPSYPNPYPSQPPPASAGASAGGRDRRGGRASATATATAISQDPYGNAQATAFAQASTNTNHCDWVNGVWTCGSNVQATQNNPYNI